MDHGYDGVGSIAAGVAAASTISATSTVDASLCSSSYLDSSPFLGLVSVPGAQYHHHCSLNFDFKLRVNTVQSADFDKMEVSLFLYLLLEGLSILFHEDDDGNTAGWFLEGYKRREKAFKRERRRAELRQSRNRGAE
ncbi:hypothetical protein PTKIN_Ptkin01aG0155000 [Pterospermum kingtungense]